MKEMYLLSIKIESLKAKEWNYIQHAQSIERWCNSPNIKMYFLRQEALLHILHDDESILGR